MNADGAQPQTQRPQAANGGGATTPTPASTAPASDAATPVTELDRVVAYANRFAIKLFKHVAALNPRSTVCVGPFAVFKTLCMAYAGAQGNTEHQMAKAFKVNKHFDMHVAFQTLLSLLRNKAAEMRQDMACHAFVERSLPLAPQFEAVLERKYETEVRRVDMKDEPDSVREQVNSTVEKETWGAVSQLLVSGVTDPDTRLVLCDSLFIKASWETVFPASAAATEKHPYTVTSSRSGGVASDCGPELVRISGAYRHCRDSENKLLAVEVPLRGGQLSLVLFLADNAPSLRRFHKHLSLELYERLLDKMQDTGERISVLVPKMHLEEMVQPSYVLKHMGFLDLFDEHANLAGVGQNLFVSDIIHKVALTIDTTGVTAAAAVSLSLTNFYTEELPKAYRDAANTRPFIYVLKSQETDLILFAGATQDI
ncbi:leukocyte elastase inhibitor-like [Dermacentor albipictus]|uniref:leukocyte elastase inhibitor-like n=1 Tax=Dermacentor albipictus TaxID=60249 RepID=UPI0038FC9449